AEDEDPQSVKLLEEALMLDPQLEDAYEVLGVILSKRDRLDEAIALMHKLADLNPDSVMAHANLSVFYLEKGDKEKAEEEKAVSMSIRMRLAAREATRAMKEEQERKQKKEEAKERMEMFSQVLEIDSEDLLANYGMGDCLVVLEEYEKAIPYLNKALAVKPMHTVAYVALARALNGLGRTKEAVDALNRGIEVASRKGDMTPLKEMQQQLAMLSGKAV
ncbi:MAG TPA: tetratricopeptide repeat protein, partial [Candidatus Obscuribacterales bacterium]